MSTENSQGINEQDVVDTQNSQESVVLTPGQGNIGRTNISFAQANAVARSLSTPSVGRNPSRWDRPSPLRQESGSGAGNGNNVVNNASSDNTGETLLQAYSACV